MRADLFSEKGTKLKTKTQLPDEIFGIKPHDAALRQYIRVYRINQRRGTSATKTRSEVSGGGRKPWPQKGTGRARHGSTRSPIWVGGGTAFGPQTRKTELSVPKKVRDLALKSALSWRASQGKVLVVERFSPPDPKTSLAAKLLGKLRLERTLVVTPGADDKTVRSFRNIPGVSVTDALSLNAYEVISARSILFLKDGIAELIKRLGAEKKRAPAKKAPAKRGAAGKTKATRAKSGSAAKTKTAGKKTAPKRTASRSRTKK